MTLITSHQQQDQACRLGMGQGRVSWPRHRGLLGTSLGMLSITSLYPLDARSTCSSRPDNHKRLQILSTIPRGRGAKIPWLRTTGRGLVSVGRNSRGCQIGSRTEPWVQLTGQELDTQQSWSGVRRLRFGDCSGETTRPPRLTPDGVKETGTRAGVRVWMGWDRSGERPGPG